ncbi:MAG: acetoacetate decarboxylase family protein [Candidatus Thorarchaeota archaeon]
MEPSFVKIPQEAKEMIKKEQKLIFYEAETASVFWETNIDVVKKLLPKPLKAPKFPLATAFVGQWADTNFTYGYSESAIFLRAEFNGKYGNYCLGMHLDGPGKDMGQIYGRELWGFPKKLANIYYKHEGRKIYGWSQRHDTKNIELTIKLTGKPNDQDIDQKMQELDALNPDARAYNFKRFPAPNGKGFDYKPWLTEVITEYRSDIIEVGEANIKLKSSIHDPWAEVEIIRILGGVYSRGTNTMVNGNVLTQVEEEEFLPYTFMNRDWF